MELIDLTSLNLTTPKPKEPGSLECTTYPPGQFVEDEFFEIGESGELILWAPVIGASSKSTTRTRTELRETTVDGKTYNWLISSAAHHWLQTAVTVDQVPASGETVISQIHVRDSNRPLLKVSYDQGRIVAGFRAKFDQATPVDYTLLSGVPLGSRLLVSVHLTSGGSLSIKVSYTDAAGTRNKGGTDQKLDANWFPELLYFKYGVYNQQTPDGHTLYEEGSRATYWKANINHDQ